MALIRALLLQYWCWQTSEAELSDKDNPGYRFTRFLRSMNKCLRGFERFVHETGWLSLSPKARKDELSFHTWDEFDELMGIPFKADRYLQSQVSEREKLPEGELAKLSVIIATTTWGNKESVIFHVIYIWSFSLMCLLYFFMKISIQSFRSTHAGKNAVPLNILNEKVVTLECFLSYLPKDHHSRHHQTIFHSLSRKASFPSLSCWMGFIKCNWFGVL